ncbi:MAG: NAD(P)-dependent alcohol dehydrogenase [Flavobacteriales bacterium]|nr:NAD(P)-dependent alcohol dehydrogenase [Flavobacteriales bacterium]
MVDMDRPVAGNDQVLIKVHYTTVTVADSRVRGFNVPPSFWLPAKLALGWSKPKRAILGTELSGVIEAVGKNVKRFRVGDEVFAFPGEKGGGYAEFMCMNENDCIAPKPVGLGFDQAAALSLGAMTALYFLQKGKVAKGERILIYGASGSMGTAAVQIAKYLGAEVTGVCSTTNLELVRQLGADEVIDYTKTDFTAFGKRYDVVFDTVGKTNAAKVAKCINAGGRYLHAVATPGTTFLSRLALMGTGIPFIGGTEKGTIAKLDFIKKLADEGSFKPVIDRHYRFDEMVAAHAYVDQGHKKGNVVIKVSGT